MPASALHSPFNGLKADKFFAVITVRICHALKISQKHFDGGNLPQNVEINWPCFVLAVAIMKAMVFH